MAVRNYVNSLPVFCIFFRTLIFMGEHTWRIWHFNKNIFLYPKAKIENTAISSDSQLQCQPTLSIRQTKQYHKIQNFKFEVNLYLSENQNVSKLWLFVRNSLFRLIFSVYNQKYKQFKKRHSLLYYSFNKRQLHRVESCAQCLRNDTVKVTQSLDADYEEQGIFFVSRTTQLISISV